MANEHLLKLANKWDKDNNPIFDGEKLKRIINSGGLAELHLAIVQDNPRLGTDMVDLVTLVTAGAITR